MSMRVDTMDEDARMHVGRLQRPGSRTAHRYDLKDDGNILVGSPLGPASRP
jgi:hypothetical protein